MQGPVSLNLSIEDKVTFFKKRLFEEIDSNKGKVIISRMTSTTLKTSKDVRRVDMESVRVSLWSATNYLMSDVDPKDIDVCLLNDEHYLVIK